MKKILLFFAGVLICISAYSQGQLNVFQDWVSNAGSQNFLIKSRTITDATKNVYIVGATLNGSGNYDILVAKYDSKGAQLWINQYNGAGNGHDVGTGIDVDAGGNVYITGTVTTATSVDLIVIRYNSSGVQLWLQTYNGTGNFYDAGADVKLVTGTNFGVYVTGSSYNASGNTDFLTIKYSPAGVFQWVNTYDHTTGMNDAAVRIIIRPTQVVVTGAVQTAASTYRCAAVRYDPLTGAQIGTAASSSSSSNITEVNDMVIDASDNIYITGTGIVAGQGNNYFTIKFNASLVLIWEEIYNGTSNLDDVAKGIQLDASGNVFVTGYTTTTTEGRNYATIKYNTGGVQQWIQFYNDALNLDDEATGIALDNSGNAYVTGYTTTALNQKDFYTIKYNTSGAMIWKIGTDGDRHLNDVSTNIVIDNAGDVVIAGQSEIAPSVYEYLTVKYVEKDVITPTDFNGEIPQNSFLFYENKGQLLATDTTLVPELKYYTNNSSPALYFKENNHSILFSRLDIDTTGGSADDSLHRIDVSFNQVNSNAKTYSMEKQPSYLNYFLAHCNPPITEIYGNQRLVTTDLYSKIDVMYSSNQNGLKYYFIIKPGGNPANLQMEYTGATSFNLNGTTNELTINSTIGSITFDRPTVYQLSSSNVIIPITGWTADWQTNGASNKYKFNIGTYDNTKALIIEVDMGNAAVSSSILNINWSTYLGGGNQDQVNGLKSDVNNNLFAVGETWAVLFPQATGATVYQPSFGGSSDGFVAKFKPTGQLEWSTYIGGSRGDRLKSLDFSSSGDIYCVGNTISGDLITQAKAGAYNNPTFVGPNDATYGWLTDGFIFQIAQNGLTSPWRTFYTGNSIDNFNKCKFDASGNFFVVGSTTSSNAPIVATGTQYNHPYTNPPATPSIPFISDGYIVRFDAAGVRTWATCLGASTSSVTDPPDDELNSLDFDASNDLYVVGRSSGTNYPNISTGSGATASTNFAQNGTRQNGAITRFSNTGAIKYSSYIGSTLTSNVRGIRISNGNTYITGYTNQNGFPLVFSGNYFPSSWQGGFDAFFTVFNGLDQIRHSTYIGGTSADEGWDIQVDQANMIYLAGKTTSSNFPVPSGGNPVNTYDSGLTGAQDYFICTLREFNTNLLWSTLVGGTGDESVGNGRWVSIATDGNNNLHLAGQTNSSALFPTDNGGGPPVHFQGTITGITDGTITRFDLAPVQLLGVNENGSLENGIFVYPNPTSSSLSIKVRNLGDKQTYKVYNSLGQIILNGKIVSEITIIELESLSSGIYLLEVSDLKTKSSIKFIKND